jgi:indolepyruvate ferredoxin oxidoreductase beta subunit
MTATPRPITILIAALGGQGGGVLAEWLVEVALNAGYPAQSTSIPGVAQRTGATTYYVEVYPETYEALGGRRPVLSLLPVPGGIDLMVASELLEAVRMVQSGMVSADRTALVTSSCRTLTTVEKMAPGDGRFDPDRLLAVAQRHSRRLVTFDMDDAARAAGTVVSSVMFGAIAASGTLPFGRDAFEGAVRDSGLPVAASLAGFARGWDAMTATPGLAPPRSAAPAGTRPTAALVSPAVATALPAVTHDMAGEGYRRLAEFQDQAYADLYLERLRRIDAAERTADPREAHECTLTRETARFLALWMAFDDIVRVADLKCRASRFARVRREVGAGERDVVRIVDYFKPGVPEVAALLPAAPARWLSGWDRRRVARGQDAFAVALTVRTNGILGFVALRTLASLTWLRRRGTRYAQEQAMIERWLAAIAAALAGDWRVAYEIALCGRLVKGYGATNERGKRNLIHILDHLATGGSFATAALRADAIRQAREAALADEDGRGLDATLVRHGAPPRPIAPQPVRWMKKRANSEMVPK